MILNVLLEVIMHFGNFGYKIAYPEIILIIEYAIEAIILSVFYLKIVKILKKEVYFQFIQTRLQFKFFYGTAIFSLGFYIFNFTMQIWV